MHLFFGAPWCTSCWAVKHRRGLVVDYTGSTTILYLYGNMSFYICWWCMYLWVTCCVECLLIDCLLGGIWWVCHPDVGRSSLRCHQWHAHHPGWKAFCDRYGECVLFSYSLTLHMFKIDTQSRFDMQTWWCFKFLKEWKTPLLHYPYFT